MQKIDFSNLIDHSVTIESTRNYWLVRTMGGDHYKEYKVDGFIAIGFNEITLDEIRLSLSYEDKASEKLKEIVKSKVSHGNATYIAHQILRFTNEIKKNDIVIMPGVRSNLVSIGVVTEDRTYVERDIPHSSECCQFNKRRKVRWIEEKSRWKLNPKMQLLFNSRHIVSDIKNYAPYIDATTNDFFVKDSKTHLVLKVRTENEIKINDFLVINDLLKLAEEISSEFGMEFSSDEIEFKSNVQSPGDLVMAAMSPHGLALIGILIIAINGGGLKIEKLGFDLHTDGIIKAVATYLDKKKDRSFKAVIAKKIEHLDIKEPDDLVNVINEMNKTREKY